MVEDSSAKRVRACSGRRGTSFRTFVLGRCPPKGYLILRFYF